MSATAETANAAVAVVSDALRNGPPIKTQGTGFSPTFWAVVSGIILQIGLVVRLWIKGVPDRTRATTEADKQVMDTLLGEIASLRTRVTEVEKQVVDERRACAQQIQGIEDRHRTEMAEVKGELKAMRDNAIQQMRSSTSLVELGRRVAPEATARLENGE